ncbi:MAG: peptidoglycan DD-metalloendopeptidase family protein [Cytophagales bacterium]|nr:peptidoglycan DD-metalloendopeptidase family protein [Cytophagales bacterium]
MVVIYILFTISEICTAQTSRKRNELEKEKQENIQKIEETNRILLETRTQKTATVGQLSVLREQIKEKNKLINTYIKEIKIVNEEIDQIENHIFGMEQKLVSLRHEYAIMIYTASKSNNAQNKLIFFFSAETFNQMIMRLKYFQQYSQERQQQVKQIKKVAVSLRKQRKKLYLKKREKQQVLASITHENNNLRMLKGEQESTVSKLIEQESKLMDEIEDRKKSLKKLEKLITDLIKAEMEKAAAKAAADAKNKLTPESVNISKIFAGNKNKLIWPVKQGFISAHFGKHKHPVFEHVIVENLGIDIQTQKNEPVRSVFDGVVKAVAEVPGMQHIVMVQHGDYFTFYAKLKTVKVKEGQKIKMKEELGEVYTNEDDVSEVQFQVWKNNEKQNPEEWLYDK